MRRSEPTTEGERRLLEWDLNKSFDLSTARVSPRGTTSGKRFDTKSFQPGAYTPKAFSAGSFYSPVFLPPDSKTLPNAFKTKTFSNTAQPLPTRTFFQANDAAPAPLRSATTDPTDSAKNAASKAFAGSNRTFSGPEADRKEMKFSMENAPRGGVFEGRKLTLDEVREILNKSK